MTDRARMLEQTLAARDHAAALLRALTDAKGVADQQPPSPKGDLYKRVTGASSVENAIAEARRTVDAYERLIGQLQKELGEATGDAPQVVVRPAGSLTGGSSA